MIIYNSCPSQRYDGSYISPNCLEYVNPTMANQELQGRFHLACSGEALPSSKEMPAIFAHTEIPSCKVEQLQARLGREVISSLDDMLPSLTATGHYNKTTKRSQRDKKRAATNTAHHIYSSSRAQLCVEQLCP